MTIYKKIKPTRLYIKQHSVTGLKYFGKTIVKNIDQYKGSGKYWKTHINKHGKRFVKTIWVSEYFYSSKEISIFATQFSIDNNIVLSPNWANLVIENGLDGGNPIKRTLKTQNKIESTCLKKYGVKNPFQVPEIIQKFRQDMLENTGYDNPSKNPIIKQQKIETCFSNYGVNYPQQSAVIKEQTKETCLEKYGYEFVLQIPEIRQKGIDICQEKWGVDNVSQAQEIKDKKEETNLKNWGVSHVFQSPVIIEKSRQTKANKPPTICPHCDKSCKGGNVTRHHFDNCKLKPM